MMKTIGMFAIVLGHFFPPTIQFLTYAFSVQLFFFVSGFLFRRCSEQRTFWRKNWHGLIVPYLILGGVNLLYRIIRNPDAYAICCSSCGLIFGISNVDNHGGCGGLWFVVTLLLLKIVFQLVKGIKALLFVLLPMLLMAFLYREVIADSQYEFWGFSLFSVFIAYPFFLVGNILSVFCYDKIFHVSSLLEQKHRILSFCIGVAVLALLYVVSPLNGVVYMIYGGFGNYFSLFLLYSAMGIIGVYFLSVSLSNARQAEWAKTISLGSIVILAFQGYFIERISPRLELFTMGRNTLYEYGSVVTSIVIMLLFIPIIRFCQRHAPVILGNRK